MSRYYALSTTLIQSDEKGVVMTWLSDQYIALGVIVVVLIVLLSHASKILHWLANHHDAFERYGDQLRDFKYQRLVPFVGRIPIPANALTSLRPLLIWLSLYFFRHHFQPGLYITLFVLGWSTDYLDGLKARAENNARRQLFSRGTYREPVLGKYLDPIADMMSITFMTVSCWIFYPRSVIVAFTGAILARTFLFGLLLFQRRYKATWRQRLSSDILPKTISGEMKAGIIATSFVLVLIGPSSPGALSWASRLLVGAIIIEVVTLTYLVRVARRMATMAKIELPRKTGTD